MPKFRRKRLSVEEKTSRKSQGKIKHIKTTIDGITFDSKMESDYYKKCKEELNKGIISKLELQPEFILQDKFIRVDGKVIYGSDPDFNKLKKKSKAKTIAAIKYIADFKLTYPDGKIRLVDTKGQATADFKIKEKMFAAKYPMYTLEVLIWDKHKLEWVDYYEYRKEENKRRKINKANKTS